MIYRVRMSGSRGQYAEVRADDFAGVAMAYMQTRGMRQRVRDGLRHVTILITLFHGPSGSMREEQYWTWDAANGVNFLQDGPS